MGFYGDELACDFFGCRETTALPEDVDAAGFDEFEGWRRIRDFIYCPGHGPLRY